MKNTVIMFCESNLTRITKVRRFLPVFLYFICEVLMSTTSLVPPDCFKARGCVCCISPNANFHVYIELLHFCSWFKILGFRIDFSPKKAHICSVFCFCWIQILSYSDSCLGFSFRMSWYNWLQTSLVECEPDLIFVSYVWIQPSMAWWNCRWTKTLLSGWKKKGRPGFWFCLLKEEKPWLGVIVTCILLLCCRKLCKLFCHFLCLEEEGESFLQPTNSLPGPFHFLLSLLHHLLVDLRLNSAACSLTHLLASFPSLAKLQ